YPESRVHELRGSAWKERGTVCVYLGDYERGLDAATIAGNEYKLVGNDAELISVNVLRATLLWKLKRNSEALQLITAAADEYLARGDEIRYIEAKETEAAILHRMGRTDVALAAYRKAFDKAETINDLAMKARAAKNIAVTAREAGDLGT